MSKNLNTLSITEETGEVHVYVFPDEAIAETITVLQEHAQRDRIDPICAALLIHYIRKELIEAAHAQDLDGIM